ncbi:glucocorticoid-induced transcript 1 protein [Brachypodium distachyon]|uniref:Uncharacterized protein n=1 Tax=Brachypodium distachyon TaxID=15368 RepID=A0A0Q3P1X0_BRADI|nr:glucocorticoid-induced transcript 1 protein [Brachypodium distachyon]KQJ82673.1 hypothetical protein BRADI_5g10408v3 [Brachypodium distachyon]|eukprot:XP_014751102.1 glucocorticoid-induced transcript 1 protein [Brachypodium distachyon]
MPTPSSPSPLLPPPAPASASRRRRRLLASTHPSSSAAASSSSSYSSSSSSASSNPPFFSPVPSPFHHRFLSPLRASAVPFSWEHRPGIPKTPARAPRCAKPPGATKPSPPLPLPPSLFSTNSNRVRVVAEYDYSVVPEKKARRRCRRTPPQRRWPAVADALGDWLAVLNLYRSCTRSRDCLAPATGPPPRPPRSSEIDGVRPVRTYYTS